MLGEMMKFFKKRENIINVTIAIVLGAAINQVTNSLIQDILWPPLKALTEKLDINPWKISFINAERFYQSLGNLILIMILVYFLFARKGVKRQ